MKYVFGILLVILTLSSYPTDAEFLEDWSDSSTDASTFLDISGTVYA